MTKIEVPYEYLDYRLILKNSLFNRNMNNPSYSLRAFARDVDSSPSFLSDVMKGKKDFSIEKAQSIFSKLGYENEELEYIEKLVMYQTNASYTIEKEKASEYISAKFLKSNYKDNSENDLLMKSVYHFILHGLAGNVIVEDAILKTAVKIGIDEITSKIILNELIEHGFLTKDANNNYGLRDVNVNISNHADLLRNQREFSNIVNQYIQNESKCNPPYTMAHYFTFGLTKEILPIFAEEYRKLINSIAKLAGESEKADYVMMFTSNYISIKNFEENVEPLSFPTVPIFKH